MNIFNYRRYDQSISQSWKQDSVSVFSIRRAVASVLLVVVLCFTGTLVLLVYLSELIALFSYNFRITGSCLLRVVANSSHSSAYHSCTGEAVHCSTCTVCHTPADRQTCRAIHQWPVGPQMPPSGTTWPQSSTSAAIGFASVSFTWNRSETFHQSGLY